MKGIISPVLYYFFSKMTSLLLFARANLKFTEFPTIFLQFGLISIDNGKTDYGLPFWSIQTMFSGIFIALV